MSHIETMKQALDALYCHTLLTRTIHKSELAMKALRAAIAQPPISKMEITQAIDQAIDAMRPLQDLIILRQAIESLEITKDRMGIAQPDEPVAYCVYFPTEQRREYCDDLDDLIDDLTNLKHEITPLYAAPQVADYVPLSDEEITDAIKNAPLVQTNYAGWIRDQRINWGRAIERAVRGGK